MNANDLWSGNDYAQTDNISRGVSYYERANRVKVLRVYKESSYGSERARTMVEVIVLNDDGTPEKDYDGTDMTRTVRARDIFMRWSEYATERKHRHEKREQIAQEQAAQQAADEDKKKKLLDMLEGKGVDRLWVSTITDYSITLNRRSVEEWLGVGQE